MNEGSIVVAESISVTNPNIRRNLYLGIKRTFDCIASLFAFIVLLPVFLFIAVAIKVESKYFINIKELEKTESIFMS